MLRSKGSTQEKSPTKIFRFDYRKAANDNKVPDPVGSEVNAAAPAPARDHSQIEFF